MRRFERYCCEDPSLIENYEKAKADDFKGWVIHHRMETKCPIFKPTWKQLVQAGLYYKRPACELIFMRREDHVSLHHKGKLSPMLGKHLSEETRKKMSEVHKGENNPLYGKHWKLVDGKRVWY